MYDLLVKGTNSQFSLGEKRLHDGMENYFQNTKLNHSIYLTKLMNLLKIFLFQIILKAIKPILIFSFRFEISSVTSF